MKKQTNKIGKIIKLITGGLLLAVLMIVNVQIGLSDGESLDTKLLNLKASVHTPTAVASGAWGYVNCGPTVHDVCEGNGSYTCCK